MCQNVLYFTGSYQLSPLFFQVTRRTSFCLLHYFSGQMTFPFLFVWFLWVFKNEDSWVSHRRNAFGCFLNETLLTWLLKKHCEFRKSVCRNFELFAEHFLPDKTRPPKNIAGNVSATILIECATHRCCASSIPTCVPTTISFLRGVFFGVVYIYRFCQSELTTVFFRSLLEMMQENSLRSGTLSKFVRLKFQQFLKGNYQRNFVLIFVNLVSNSGFFDGLWTHLLVCLTALKNSWKLSLKNSSSCLLNFTSW